MVAFFVTACKVWPPDEVFSASPEELRLLGSAIAKKQGMEQEFQAMIHGAKLKPRASDAKSLDQQLIEGKAKGLPIEITGKG